MYKKEKNGAVSDCAEAMSLMKMCDCEVEGQRSFNESTQLGDQPSLDLQELWNLVENSSPPPTQITDSQGLTIFFKKFHQIFRASNRNVDYMNALLRPVSFDLQFT